MNCYIICSVFRMNKKYLTFDFIIITCNKKPTPRSRGLLDLTCSCLRCYRNSLYLNWNVRYYLYRSLSLDSFLSQMNPVFIYMPYFVRSIWIPASCLQLTVVSAACSTCLVSLALITLIVLGEKYKLWASHCLNFLQHPLTSLSEAQAFS